MEKIPGWSLRKDGQITAEWKFPDFKSALAFANQVGIIAEELNHHPDMLVQWGKLTLSVITHDQGKITEKDFELARQVNQLALRSF